jgi:hypothetical protein
MEAEVMQLTGKARVVLMALLMACLAAPTATAQITTGTIAGTIALRGRPRAGGRGREPRTTIVWIALHWVPFHR